MEVYILKYEKNIFSGQGDLFFETEKELIDYVNQTLEEDVKTIQDIENISDLFLEIFDHREWYIINGNPLLFKQGRRIKGYIKQSYKGFKFYSGKPSDTNCLSWDFDNFNDCIRYASQYIDNLKICL